jgi:hypothetical protein
MPTPCSVQDDFVDIDAVTDELYSLPPQEFTTTRGNREKQARAAGDRKLAAAIHLLPKPTTAAWLANQLVREHPDEISQFLDLGVVLREATATLRGARLRELDQQKRRRVHALMAQVRAVAAAAGHQVTESTARGVQDTLHAVLADEAAADQLRAGRLTDALHRTGFPPATNSPSAKPAPAQPADTETDVPATAARALEAQRSRAELEEQLARTGLRDAARAGDKARAVADRAESAARAAAAQVGRLRADLDQAEFEAQLGEQEHLKAQADAERAETEAREAARRLVDAVQARLAIDVADVSHAGAPSKPAESTEGTLRDRLAGS